MKVINTLLIQTLKKTLSYLVVLVWVLSCVLSGWLGFMAGKDNGMLAAYNSFLQLQNVTDKLLIQVETKERKGVKPSMLKNKFGNALSS